MSKQSDTLQPEHTTATLLQETSMTHATGKPEAHIAVPIRADTSHLSQNEKQVLGMLTTATRLINIPYVRQAKQNMVETRGVFDASRGMNYYPEGMSRKDIENYLDEHPDERDDIMSPYTVVEKSEHDDGSLVAIPYSEYWREHFGYISALLEEAATLTDHKPFQTFLRSRAMAFRTNRYRESDIDWVRVVDAPLELTIGPYEEYEDRLFGVKRYMEGVLGVVLPKETANARRFQKEVAAFDVHLGLKYGYEASTTLTPMVVMDEVVAGGGSWYGYIAMAYNLPNDADIQREVGSKKVFVRNIMREKMEHITKPIAARVLDRHIAGLLKPEVFMHFVIGHESSHGLSFRFSGDDFSVLGSPLEEGKADVFGMLFLYFLAKRGVVTSGCAETAVIANLTDGLRQIRFGIGEAHAVGTLIQYNWFLKHGAMRFTDAGLEFRPDLFEGVLNHLGDELYALSQTKSFIAAQKFKNVWGCVPDEVRMLITSFKDIPVDIDPVF